MGKKLIGKGVATKSYRKDKLFSCCPKKVLLDINGPALLCLTLSLKYAMVYAILRK